MRRSKSLSSNSSKRAIIASIRGSGGGGGRLTLRGSAGAGGSTALGFSGGAGFTLASAAFLRASSSSFERQHFLYFLPLPQWQGSLRPMSTLSRSFLPGARDQALARFNISSRRALNSVPGFHSGHFSPCATRWPTWKSRRRSSTAPDKSQSGFTSSETL